MFTTEKVEQEYQKTELEIKVYNTLSINRGHSNAIGLKEMCKRLQIKEERKVRLAIESLRHQHYLIIFLPQEKVYKIINGKQVPTGEVLPAGYFLPASKEEVFKFLEYMRSRIKAECIILRDIRLAMNQNFNKEFGQLPMFL